jgi:putrescine transport system permease protein
MDPLQHHLVVLGFAFLYLPIVLLVIFSFNESKLVTVWGGFSTKWYASLFHNQALHGCGLGDGARRRHLGHGGTVLGTLAALTLVRYTRFRAACCFPAWSMRRWSCRK